MALAQDFDILVHLRDFITSGGKPQQAIKALSEGYHGA